VRPAIRSQLTVLRGRLARMTGPAADGDALRLALLHQRYHEWMKSPELLETTASEPLSLEEEYDMQSEPLTLLAVGLIADQSLKPLPGDPSGKWHLDDDSAYEETICRAAPD
jgi:hypothetical protein